MQTHSGVEVGPVRMRTQRQRLEPISWTSEMRLSKDFHHATAQLLYDGPPRATTRSSGVAEHTKSSRKRAPGRPMKERCSCFMAVSMPCLLFVKVG